MQAKSFVRIVAVLATASLVLAGCDQGDRARAAAGRAGAEASVMIDSVNYMHERAVQYTLYDLAQQPPQAIGGSIVVMLASGGEKGCCLNLPKTWRPGIKVRLDWQESDRERSYPEKYTREMEVPHYETPADLYVVFFAPHEVELVVSAAEPGQPEWRGSIRQAPWDRCVEEFGRKPCKAALPKLFDKSSSRGSCTYMKAEKIDKADELCEWAMITCMRDYEDEPFCKDLLWAPYKQ